MIKFLVNSLGKDATSLVMNGGSTDSNYDINDIISGERSEQWRDGADRTVSQTVNIEYRLSSGTFDWDYCVVARADYLAISKNPMRLLIRDTTNAGGSGGYGTVKTYNPVLTTDLVGKKVNDEHGQDLVFINSSTRTAKTGLRMQMQNTSGSDVQARQLSKVYCGESFSFGDDTNPSIGNHGVELLRGAIQEFSPLRGNQIYHTEARFNLNFKSLTRTQVDNFLALDKLLSWPMFIYDEDAEVFPDKLEHAIIETYVEKLVSPNIWDLEITFQRLKHYV